MHNFYPLNTSLIAIDGNACYSKHAAMIIYPPPTHTHKGYSLIPRPHPQGGKGSGIHRALSGAHRCMIDMTTHRLGMAMHKPLSHVCSIRLGQCNMIITCKPYGVNLIGATEFWTEMSSSPRKRSMYTRPFPSLRVGSGNKIIFWHAQIASWSHYSWLWLRTINRFLNTHKWSMHLYLCTILVTSITLLIFDTKTW